MKMIKAEPEVGGKIERAKGFPGSFAKDEVPADGGFTATELQAAVNLVLLSESSSASMGKSGRHPAALANSCSSTDGASSLASVNTRHPAACAGPAAAADDDEVGESGAAGSDSDPMIDEDTRGPWARARRYRSLRGLYLVTTRLDGYVEEAAGRKRKSAPLMAKATAAQPMQATAIKRKSRM